MKVHLVDGTFELFRAFFGAPPAFDAARQPVGAIRGLLATLVSLLREPGVTHVACAFDHVIESFRNDLFDGYKTSEGIDPDLLAQFFPSERWPPWASSFGRWWSSRRTMRSPLRPSASGMPRESSRWSSARPTRIFRSASWRVG
jgi:hypothetical protein